MSEFVWAAPVLGALIGSFLNVLIHRLPLGQDVAMARSACPKCGAGIPFYLNVPILAYVVLRGACKVCKQPIHWRYPVVELVTAVMFYLAFPTDASMASIYTAVLQAGIGCALVVHFFIDLEHRLLLDKINIYLLMLILPYAVIFYVPSHWILGAGLGFLGPLGISWAFYKIKGKVGLGGGDIKLWGVLGLLFGPLGIMTNIFFSSLLGSVVGVALIVRKTYARDEGIPFGPFIILVALGQLFFPEVFEAIGLFE